MRIWRFVSSITQIHMQTFLAQQTKSSHHIPIHLYHHPEQFHGYIRPKQTMKHINTIYSRMNPEHKIYRTSKTHICVGVQVWTEHIYAVAPHTNILGDHRAAQRKPFAYTCIGAITAARVVTQGTPNSATQELCELMQYSTSP